MEKEKFKITIIDFLPEYGKHEVGKDKNEVPVHFGDMVQSDGEKWFIAYRYGKILLKQIGMMAMIGSEDFDKGDFTSLEKLNIIGAGNDYLLIGYKDEPFYEKIKHIQL